MRQALIIVLSSIVAIGCANSRRSVRGPVCGGYFTSCNLEAPRPICPSQSIPGPDFYVSDPDRLEGLVSADDVSNFLGPDTTYSSFAAAVAEADAVWYYNDPFTEALIAVRGCTVLSEMTLVIREMY